MYYRMKHRVSIHPMEHMNILIDPHEDPIEDPLILWEMYDLTQHLEDEWLAEL